MKLESERLILREWEQTDIPDLIEGLNDLAVSKWLAFVPYPYNKSEAEKFINFCLASRKDNRSEYEFAIELKSEKKVIGGTALSRINRLHGTAGGGIWINRNYQGHGYASEAFGRRIKFAFEDMNLRRLENGFFEGNGASLRIQERYGYKVEGKKRRAFRCMADGELRDEVITGLLIDEWIKG
jgi:ribosomal-protein-alanine N-acetyltransferase